MALDQRVGQGTRTVETLYHQRLRPALEYTDLRELVRLAISLENLYGFPLDIEFAFTGVRLQILQARPIPLFQTLLLETVRRYPLAGLPPEESDPRS